MPLERKHWLNHVKEVVRSRQYTWLPRGLAGESVEEAMTCLATDIMHICKLAGVSVERIIDGARQRFEQEETAQFPAATPTVEIPHVMSAEEADRVFAAYESEDRYGAEIVRGILQGEGIACRLESQIQGGPTDLVETKVLVHSSDAEAAQTAISEAHKAHGGISDD